MFLSIEYKINSESEKEIVKKINKIIGDEVLCFDLRRLDYRESFIDATYQVNVSKIEILENIINKLNSQFPKISVTYLDQKVKCLVFKNTMFLKVPTDTRYELKFVSYEHNYNTIINWIKLHELNFSKIYDSRIVNNIISTMKL